MRNCSRMLLMHFRFIKDIFAKIQILRWKEKKTRNRMAVILGIVPLVIGCLAFFIPEEVRVQVEIFPFSAMGVLVFIFGIVLVAIVFAHYIGDKLSEGKY